MNVPPDGRKDPPDKTDRPPQGQKAEVLPTAASPAASAQAAEPAAASPEPPHPPASGPQLSKPPEPQAGAPPEAPKPPAAPPAQGSARATPGVSGLAVPAQAPAESTTFPEARADTKAQAKPATAPFEETAHAPRPNGQTKAPAAPPPSVSPPSATSTKVASPTATPVVPPSTPTSTRGRTGLLWAAIAVLALVVGWQTFERINDPAADPALAALASRVAALEGRPTPAAQADPRLEELARRLAALEARPAVAAAAAADPRVDDLAGRLDALERRPVEDARVADLVARLAALEQRPMQDDRVPDLANRLAALEVRPVQDARVPDLAARLSALEQRPMQDPRVDALAARLAALEQRPMQDPRLDALAARLAAAMAAQAALETGRPLGPALAMLPAGTSVPPSLMLFAERSPPTVASLRRAFPNAAKAARELRETVGADFWERTGNRLTGLVTVRRAGSVVIGDPVTTLLAEAEKALEASDLRGALTALSSLPPGAARAMCDWIADAQSVITARDDIVALAAGR